MSPKLTSQISIKLPEDTLEILREIKKKHRIEPVELVRGLIDEAVAHYRRQNHFTFPILITDMPYPALQKVCDFLGERFGEKGVMAGLDFHPAVTPEQFSPHAVPALALAVAETKAKYGKKA